MHRRPLLLLAWRRSALAAIVVLGAVAHGAAAGQAVPEPSASTADTAPANAVGTGDPATPDDPTQGPAATDAAGATSAARTADPSASANAVGTGATEPGAASAVPGPSPRRADAPLGSLFRGPFQSSRLFAMPSADVVGAYMLSLSGDASLLEKPGILTSAGVIAIGFGDIAQLEYRHTEAIGITGLNAPVPAVGVQLKLPLPERSGVPALGVAFRLGVPRSEPLAGTVIDETVTDLYLVGRLRFASLPWLTLHGGTRISSAKATPRDGSPAEQRTLWLPTAGYELDMTARAKIVGEIALAPQFQWMPSVSARPTIGHGLLGRLGMRWRVLPSIVLDGSLGYQVDDAAPTEGFDAVVKWDIRLGAEVFVPWGALACRAVGAFCD